MDLNFMILDFIGCQGVQEGQETVCCSVEDTVNLTREFILVQSGTLLPQ